MSGWPFPRAAARPRAFSARPWRGGEPRGPALQFCPFPGAPWQETNPVSFSYTAAHTCCIPLRSQSFGRVRGRWGGRAGGGGERAREGVCKFCLAAS